MQTPLLGGAALLAVFWLWMLRRRQPAFVGSNDPGAIAALNRSQIAQLWAPEAPSELVAGGDGPSVDPGTTNPPALPVPTDRAGQVALLENLSRKLRGDAAERLTAVRTARAWGHWSTLPLLRRGLRDVDPAVVLEAARAIESFRGRTLINGIPMAVQQPLPRNVARMR